MNEPLPLVIANHKANKTWEELSSWIDTVGEKTAQFQGTVILAPSTPFLFSAFQKISQANFNIKLASQDISQFEQGAHTGDFAASQINKIVSFGIIGHSERRNSFQETDEILVSKVKAAIEGQIKPVFCVQDESTLVPEGIGIVAYEPISAIGTGNPDTPENAQEVSTKLRETHQRTVLYGGSVTPQNVKSFLKKGEIDGVLVGTASLDPEEFVKIIEAANY